MTAGQIQQTILSAQYLQATMTEANRVQLSVGNAIVPWAQIKRLNRNTIALQYQLNRGNFVTTTLYDCLNSIIGVDLTNNTIDPNFQNPNIIIEDGGGSGFEPTIITFADTDLLDAGGGNWYLPWSNAGTPVSVVDNLVSFTFQYDASVSPARIYGFSTNAPVQVIVVTAIGAPSSPPVLSGFPYTLPFPL